MKAIIAIDKNFGIGYKNKLPWPPNKEDLTFFKETTLNYNVVMGRKTWESLPKKLPKRSNIVLSSNILPGPDYVFENIDEMIANIDLNQTFVIGGKQIYTLLLPYITSFYVTHFYNEYMCDTFMENNFLSNFSIKNTLMQTPKFKICEYSRC